MPDMYNLLGGELSPRKRPGNTACSLSSSLPQATQLYSQRPYAVGSRSPRDKRSNPRPVASTVCCSRRVSSRENLLALDSIAEAPQEHDVDPIVEHVSGAVCIGASTVLDLFNLSPRSPRLIPSSGSDAREEASDTSEDDTSEDDIEDSNYDDVSPNGADDEGDMGVATPADDTFPSPKLFDSRGLKSIKLGLRKRPDLSSAASGGKFIPKETAADGVHQRLKRVGSALYLAAEATWHDLDEDDTEIIGDGASTPKSAEVGTPHKVKQQLDSGPGKVTGYTIPAKLVPTDSKDCICSSKQLLWFSLLHQAALLLTGLAGWMLAGCRPWVCLSSYLMVGIGLWGTHWAGHRRWVWQPWFEHHTIGHHVKSYPPAKFLSQRYVSTVQRKVGTARPSTGLGIDLSLNTLVYLPTPLVTAVLHRVVFGLVAMEAALVLLVGMAVCLEQELIHRHVHTVGSRLERYRWFQAMRAMHFLHHTDGMKHNYAMADFFLDVLSGNLINTV